MSTSSPEPGAARARIKVLIIDDSALVRQLLTGIFQRERDFEVVGAASNPLQAREMIRATNPDVLTLDIEMPQMDGLDFLERLMRLRPMPVVMVSTLTARGSEATLRALELGAVDFVAKPKLGIAQGIEAYAEDIVAKVRAAAKVRHAPRAARPAAAPLPAIANRRLSTEQLVFIGASTGGTEAIREVVERLPPDTPAILVTQHMPPGFTRTFAARLDSLSRMAVCEATDGQRVLPGHVYIAPGDRHMRIGRSGSDYVVALDDTPHVNRHRPSVEVLFRSAAQVAGRNAIGIMLTGMGKDGALAMREMHEAGAYTVAQDEASCVVFGMPKEAIATGGVDSVLPLAEIGPQLIRQVAARGGATSHRV
ncbi:MAG: chemotaxis response regulator protein-glutamate methylesterase [Burkholderiales bacterium]|nr:chemotaxis response regulator protein-glutamate methylesterase [Burkholderiales bacterium]